MEKGRCLTNFSTNKKIVISINKITTSSNVSILSNLTKTT